MMYPPFLNLSAEILIEILTHLPLRDIVACKLACRKLHDIIANSSLLQYIIQTFLAGVYDPLLPGASIVERMSALKSLEARWRDLDVRRRTGTIRSTTISFWQCVATATIPINLPVIPTLIYASKLLLPIRSGRRSMFPGTASIACLHSLSMKMTLPLS